MKALRRKLAASVSQQERFLYERTSGEAYFPVGDVGLPAGHKGTQKVQSGCCLVSADETDSFCSSFISKRSFGQEEVQLEPVEQSQGSRR